MSGQYTHILGSKDLLKDISDKYDDLAKVSYFDNDNQVNWELKIMDLTDELNRQFKAQGALDEDEKARKSTRKNVSVI